MAKKSSSKSGSKMKKKLVTKVKSKPQAKSAAKKTKALKSTKLKAQKPANLERAGASANAASTLPPVSLKQKPMTRPNSCRIVAICNQKGGCGKTTSVINIAAGLALRGQRVLVVDLDSQANASTGLGISADDVELSTFHLLTDLKNVSIGDVVLETQFENLHIAPASIELSEFESKVASEIGRENRLKKALAPAIEHYDFIVIDTPPSLGLLSVNALNAATEVNIALQAHPFAFDGLNLLLESIELVKEELNPKLRISGIVVTMFDPRTKISHEIVQRVMGVPELKPVVFKNVVHQNVKLTEASRMRKPVFYYNPACSGSHDYLNLVEEICMQHAGKTNSKASGRSKEARS